MNDATGPEIPPSDATRLLTFPLNAFLRSDLRSVDESTVALLSAAEVIVGVDVMSGREFPLFGAATLREIVAEGRGRWLPVLRITLDESSDELALACRLVLAVKASCDYPGGAAR